MSPGEWFAGLGRDVLQAVRALLARPTYTVGALLSLSLGIGANVVIYSVVSAVMIHAYNFPDADRLVDVYAVRKNDPHATLAPASVDRLAREASTFSSVGAVASGPVPSALTIPGGHTEMINGKAVTPSLFPTLRITPLLGRLFRTEDAQAGRPRVVILRERMWRETFAADPDIVGRTISLDDTPYTVVGVIRDRDAYPAETQDLWVPYPDSTMAGDFNIGNMRVVARLAPGTTLGQARAQVAVIARQISSKHPNSWSNAELAVAQMRVDELAYLRPFVLILEATVTLVLLIACANTANLALSRVISRERELAVRVALGATRWQIARLLLTESVILALVGGALGVLLATWGVPLLRDHLVSVSFTRGVAGWSSIAVDGPVLQFAALVAVATGVLFGLAPALHASHVNLTAPLKDGGRSVSAGVNGARLRTALVVGQFVLALVLTVGAALVARSVAGLLRTDPGFTPQHVITVTVGLPRGRYVRDSAARQVTRELVARAAALPGVQAAALASFLPLTNSYNITQATAASSAPISDRDKPMALEQSVTADYFRLLGIRILRGGTWSPSTTGDTTRFVVVNDALVKKLLPGRDPIGAVIKMGWGSASIIGVVADTRAAQLEEPQPDMHVYEPMETQPQWRRYSLLVRVAGDPAAATGMIRREIGAVDPGIAVGDVKTMHNVVTDYLSGWLLMLVLIGGFALVALVIAGIGIYGVVSYSVSQRTHELGIRMALGAQARDVVRLVVRQSLVPMLLALPVALIGAWAVARLLRSLLYGVGTVDLPTYLGVTLLLLAIAVIASLVPARRAASVAPSVSLRYE